MRACALGWPTSGATSGWWPASTRVIQIRAFEGRRMAAAAAPLLQQQPGVAIPTRLRRKDVHWRLRTTAPVTSLSSGDSERGLLPAALCGCSTCHFSCTRRPIFEPTGSHQVITLKVSGLHFYCASWQARLDSDMTYRCRNTSQTLGSFAKYAAAPVRPAAATVTASTGCSPDCVARALVRMPIACAAVPAWTSTCCTKMCT